MKLLLMKKFFKQNRFFITLSFLAILSSAFLLNEHFNNKNISEVATTQSELINKNIEIEEDDFESTDFNLINNLSEAINEIFSFRN
jgi:hypothetical protein